MKPASKRAAIEASRPTNCYSTVKAAIDSARKAAGMLQMPIPVYQYKSGRGHTYGLWRNPEGDPDNGPAECLVTVIDPPT